MWLGLVESMVYPPAGPLIVIAAGLVVVLATKHRKTGLAVAFSGVLILYLACIPAVSNPLLKSLDSRYGVLTEVPAEIGAIVVLSGGSDADSPVYEGGSVNCTSLDRVRYAAYLGIKYGFPVMVSGGGSHGKGASDAALMRDVMETEFGVPVRWAESISRNTYENAQYTSRILGKEGIKDILLVTHGYHMRRAVWSFERFGMNVVPAPMGQSTGISGAGWLYAVLPQSTGRIRIVLHEWLGLIWYRMKYA